MDGDPDSTIVLRDEERSRLVEKSATCPFVGSAVAEGKLDVRNSVGNPLASIADVRELGNSGGGDLGEVLVLFATGNHASMLGDGGKLDEPVPAGLFSLEFPGSQGAHPGHSGILMGDPTALRSGRLSSVDFARLANRAANGLIRRSDAGRFIAENLSNDPDAKVFGANVAIAFGGDLLAFASTIGPSLLSALRGTDDEAEHGLRRLEQKITKLLGEDNLIGSAGEFGLLFALMANRPDAPLVDGEPTVSVQDLERMFVQKRLPVGFETWRKLRTDWVTNTIALIIAASKKFSVDKV